MGFGGLTLEERDSILKKIESGVENTKIRANPYRTLRKKRSSSFPFVRNNIKIEQDVHVGSEYDEYVQYFEELKIKKIESQLFRKITLPLIHYWFILYPKASSKLCIELYSDEYEAQFNRYDYFTLEAQKQQEWNVIKSKIVIPLIHYWFTIYPNFSENYTELLFKEYGKRFKEYDLLKHPKKIIQKINSERYMELGKITSRINVFCEKCGYEFSYIYKGGPHRHYCPSCSDWLKKFPNESQDSYCMIGGV